MDYKEVIKDSFYWYDIDGLNSIYELIKYINNINKKLDSFIYQECIDDIFFEYIFDVADVGFVKLTISQEEKDYLETNDRETTNKKMFELIDRIELLSESEELELIWYMLSDIVDCDKLQKYGYSAHLDKESQELKLQKGFGGSSSRFTSKKKFSLKLQ